MSNGEFLLDRALWPRCAHLVRAGLVSKPPAVNPGYYTEACAARRCGCTGAMVCDLPLPVAFPAGDAARTAHLLAESNLEVIEILVEHAHLTDVAYERLGAATHSIWVALRIGRRNLGLGDRTVRVAS